MSSIITKTIKGGQYLYESTSYRDEQGRPRTSRVYIGKVESNTGAHVYTKAYIERLHAKGAQLDDAAMNNKCHSDNDIRQSKTLEYGALYFYKQIAKGIGLYRVLQEAMPNCWQDVFTIYSRAKILANNREWLYIKERNQ